MVFLILVYIHTVFARTPMDCLRHVEKTWPRDGILRVEIIKNVSEDYTIFQSYEKEYRGYEDYLWNGTSYNVATSGEVTEAMLQEEMRKYGFIAPRQDMDFETLHKIYMGNFSHATDETPQTSETDSHVEEIESNSSQTPPEEVQRGNLQPFRETLTELEMLTNAGK